MVRRHSLPPHALKRQNSRFKIGAGVAAAAGAGATLLAVGLCLRLTPPPAVPAPTPARVEVRDDGGRRRAADARQQPVAHAHGQRLGAADARGCDRGE